MISYYTDRHSDDDDQVRMFNRAEFNDLKLCIGLYPVGSSLCLYNSSSSEKIVTQKKQGGHSATRIRQAGSCLTYRVIHYSLGSPFDSISRELGTNIVGCLR